MPPARAFWAGLYAFVTTLCTAIVGLYAQLSSTQTSIGKGAWIIAVAGALMAGAGAVKAGWPPDAPPPSRIVTPGG